MGNLNIDELYSAAEDSRLRAFETARQDSLSRLQSNLDSITQSYRSNVTQAQTASRISALGQEEKLAASGLSSGSAYAAATSGYTESARVASNNNLRSNINALSTTRMQQEQEARTTSSSEIAQAQQTYDNSIADLQTQKAEAKISQYNTDRNYETEQKQFAYQSAMERWQTYGVVLPADAEILGVPAGTRTASSAYNNARLAFDKWKALLNA